jgi:RNA polymerase sigma-70 factor (ECF subfamily)
VFRRTGEGQSLSGPRMSPEEQRSVELMKALSEGDLSCMRGLVELWEAPLLRFCYRYLQSEHEAREAVQDTFVRIHRSCASYQPGRSFAAWMYVIAANLCRNRRRWHRRHPFLSLDWLRESGGDRLECPRGGPDGALLEGERVQAVRRAVERLPHEEKTVLILHEYENLGYREVSAATGLSERRVETLLARARGRLRASLAGLAGRGPEGPAGAVTFSCSSQR